MKKEWFPYSPKGRSGVKVATADLDDNGIDEIITFTTNVFTLTSINNQ